MSFEVEVSADAEADVDEAVDWYQERSDRAAAEFVKQVRVTIDRIAENPQVYGVVHSGLRRAQVKRFPYGVFYRVGGRHIEVVAVMHDRRDPATWQSRT